MANTNNSEYRENPSPGSSHSSSDSSSRSETPKHRENGHRSPGPVPDRWLHCPRKSDGFIADRFLAFKTPLDERFDSQLPVEAYFSPELVMQSLRVQKRRLGLWIDLTNTTRFYDRRIVKNFNAKYVKLQCRGHGETPSKEQTNMFIQLVDNYLVTHQDDIIGVHCTHGFNRTGFLIACYLVERLNFSVEAAIGCFSDARPPGIYKQDYIEELFRRYNNTDQVPDAPALPSWDNVPRPKRRRESSSPSEGDDSPSQRKKRRLCADAKFVDGISGVELMLDRNLVNQLQDKCREMCNYSGDGFPGTHPVSLSARNLTSFNVRPYRVSWKADGTRYMMLILDQGQIYMFDRDNNCFKVNNLTFPHAKNSNGHLKDTLLDGEMVLDKVNGATIPRFLIFDIVWFNGKNVTDMDFFPDRGSIIDREIIGIRADYIAHGHIKRQEEPFGIRIKHFWDVADTGLLLQPKFCDSLSHGSDGLVFQPKFEPYRSGRYPYVLKWKPPQQNSVDFRLKIMHDGRTSRAFLYVTQHKGPFAEMRYSRTIRHFNNKIIECKFENNAWVFMRERTDKSFPNSFNTAQGVIESILHPVTTEVLLDYIKNHRFNLD
ncbi:mRNA-capping enzyme-like [Phlebotomus argentipes]|uniref:mRNA-capping enzyme-like n=1 Tax=Phlebotomus argentipes TaxID=94469 RepID=UPI002892E5A3|nr:mRNA-capping enzyme-like [Phlebotomus argentipes]